MNFFNPVRKKPGIANETQFLFCNLRFNLEFLIHLIINVKHSLSFIRFGLNESGERPFKFVGNLHRDGISCGGLLLICCWQGIHFSTFHQDENRWLSETYHWRLQKLQSNLIILNTQVKYEYPWCIPRSGFGAFLFNFLTDIFLGFF